MCILKDLFPAQILIIRWLSNMEGNSRTRTNTRIASLKYLRVQMKYKLSSAFDKLLVKLCGKNQTRLYY